MFLGEKGAIDEVIPLPVVVCLLVPFPMSYFMTREDAALVSAMSTISRIVRSFKIQLVLFRSVTALRCFDPSYCSKEGRDHPNSLFASALVFKEVEFGQSRFRSVGVYGMTVCIDVEVG